MTKFEDYLKRKQLGMHLGQQGWHLDDYDFGHQPCNCILYVYDVFDTGALAITGTCADSLETAKHEPYSMAEASAAVCYFIKAPQSTAFERDERGKGLAAASVLYYSQTKTWELARAQIGDNVMHGLILWYARKGHDAGKLRPAHMIGGKDVLSIHDIRLWAEEAIQYDRLKNPNFLPSADVVILDPKP